MKSDFSNRLQAMVSYGAIIVVAMFSGCDSMSSLTSDTSDAASPPQVESRAPRNLGWLGGSAIPVDNVVAITDPENASKEVATGAIRLALVDENGPLDAAGFRVDDTIVRVGENWLPIKTDATLDFIALIEDAINRDRKSVVVSHVRAKKYSTLNLKLTQTKIDDGLPLPSPRIVTSTESALNRLAEMQNDDGSFSAGAPPEHEMGAMLMATSVSGLALISADPSIATKYHDNVAQSLTFISSLYSAQPYPEPDPLTASYLIQFIAESEIEFRESNWLDVVASLTENLNHQQEESGRWSIEQSESWTNKHARVDVIGTFTTNQALLAIGALERKGFEPEARVIERACRYLDEQANIRVSSDLDRRIKAVLSAGSAAALTAINCDRSNKRLARLLDEAMLRVADIHSSPCLSWSGFLHLAILSRQFGNDTWVQFHNATKFFAIATYRRDGTIAEFPNRNTQLLDFERRVDAEIWRTAHFLIAQSLQSRVLEKSLALVQPDSMDTRDHLGKTFVPPVSEEEGAEQARQRAEMTQMILQKLKESGMDVDESDLNPTPKKVKSNDD